MKDKSKQALEEILNESFLEYSKLRYISDDEISDLKRIIFEKFEEKENYV